MSFACASGFDQHQPRAVYYELKRTRNGRLVLNMASLWPDPDMTPERWIAEEKLMPVALNDYHYAEDLGP